MAGNIKDYVSAIGALVSNTATELTGKQGALDIVNGYKAYVKTQTDAAAASTDKKTSEIKSYEEWKKLEGKAVVDKAKLEEITAADSFINNNETVKKAKADLFKDGKEVYDASSSWIGSNWMGIAAAVGGFLLADNFLGLGTIGSLLVGAIGMIAAGAMGGDPNSLGSQIFTGIKRMFGFEKDDATPKPDLPALKLNKEGKVAKEGEEVVTEIYAKGNGTGFDVQEIRTKRSDGKFGAPFKPTEAITLAVGEKGEISLDRSSDPMKSALQRQVAVAKVAAESEARDTARGLQASQIQMTLDNPLGASTKAGDSVSAVYADKGEIKVTTSDGKTQTFSARMTGTFVQATDAEGKLLVDKDTNKPVLVPKFTSVELVDEKGTPTGVKLDAARVTGDVTFDGWKMQAVGDGKYVVEPGKYRDSFMAALQSNAQDYAESVDKKAGTKIETDLANDKITKGAKVQNADGGIDMVINLTQADLPSQEARNFTATVVAGERKDTAGKDKFSPDLLISGTEVVVVRGQPPVALPFADKKPVVLKDVVDPATGEVKEDKLREALSKSPVVAKMKEVGPNKPGESFPLASQTFAARPKGAEVPQPSK